MTPSHLPLIPTMELLAFAKRHAVPLGRTNPYRTLNHYVQRGLLPRKCRYSDGRIRWGFPRSAKTLLLRIRDFKQEGLRLDAIREKLRELIDHEVESVKHAPPTLGAPEEGDALPPDTNLSYFHEKAHEARNLLRAGLRQNVDRILEEVVDLTAPHEPGDAPRIIIEKGPPMTEVYKVASSGRADYLCSVSAMQPFTLDHWYGSGRFHCVIPGQTEPEFKYDVLVPDTKDLSLEAFLSLKKSGPTLECVNVLPFHEYKIYRVEAEKASFVCQDSLWRITPQALGREYGARRFRLVVEGGDGTGRAYGLVIPQAPKDLTRYHEGGCEIFVGRTVPSAPPAIRERHPVTCPGCRRQVARPNGDSWFFSTSGVVFHPNGSVLQIKCKHCKTPIRFHLA